SFLEKNRKYNLELFKYFLDNHGTEDYEDFCYFTKDNKIVSSLDSSYKHKEVLEILRELYLQNKDKIKEDEATDPEPKNPEPIDPEPVDDPPNDINKETKERIITQADKRLEENTPYEVEYGGKNYTIQKTADKITIYLGDEEQKRFGICKGDLMNIQGIGSLSETDIINMLQKLCEEKETPDQTLSRNIERLFVKNHDTFPVTIDGKKYFLQRSEFDLDSGDQENLLLALWISEDEESFNSFLCLIKNDYSFSPKGSEYSFSEIRTILQAVHEQNKYKIESVALQRARELFEEKDTYEIEYDNKKYSLSLNIDESDNTAITNIYVYRGDEYKGEFSLTAENTFRNI
ncbi:MAG: hypothetical protein GY756_10485, partial [bacterium]|nr:hypothetical protein [bacterium]